VARRAARVPRAPFIGILTNAEALLEAVLTRLHLNMVGHLPDTEACAGGLRQQLIILGMQLLGVSDRQIRACASCVP